MNTTPTQRPRRTRTTCRSRLNTATTAVLVLLLAVPLAAALLDPDAASAAGATLLDPPPGYDESVEAQEALIAVMNNIRNVAVGLLAGLATLVLTISGVRWLASGGNTVETEKAKAGFKAAAVGYVLAALAPVFFALLAYVVSFR